MVGAKAVTANPALKMFGVLVGEWKTSGSHPYFPGAKLHGQVSFEWIEGGAFLLMRSQVDHPKFPDGIAIFGSDNEAQTYYMIYFDERGISRKHDVSITENQLTWWRDDPSFAQRYTIDLTKDKLVGFGEMSRDGGEWEKDLSLTYEKLSATA
jgi:hypothetical protein